MALRETLEADLKKAMLNRDEVARDTLRMAKSEILLREVELGRSADDAEVITVLKRGIKTRRETIDSFEQGGRGDAASREKLEIEVLSRYLPAEMDAAAAEAAVTALVKELGLSSKKDMGKLMKELKARHPSLDGKLASQLAGKLLQ